MKFRWRDIVILFLVLSLAGSFVYHLFKHIYEEDARTDINMYALFPAPPKALVRVQQTQYWNRSSSDKQTIQQLFGEQMPRLYQQLFALHPVNNVWFCLYPEGMICILPTTPEEAGKLQQKMKQLLNTFPPQKVSQNGIDVYYYADAENEFAGAFYANGLWVSSYNKVLLDQTLQRINLQIHPTQETNIPLAHATTSLLIPASELSFRVCSDDSICWQYTDTWLSTDIYRTDQKMTFIFNLPISSSQNDSLPAVITDSLQQSISRYLQLKPERIGSTYKAEDGNLYIALDYPTDLP